MDSPERRETVNIVWKGTQQEGLELVNAIARNCACVYGAFGLRASVCGGHEMLLKDQRALNGLLFARKLKDRWIKEETTG